MKKRRKIERKKSLSAGIGDSMMLVDELRNHQKSRIDDPGSLLYKIFVEDQLPYLEADTAETLSDSSMMASSSGPHTNPIQRSQAEIAQAQLPASVIGKTVEDATKQFHGNRGRD